MRPGHKIRTDSGMECQIEQSLGSGGQGEVFRASCGGKPVAVKWYYPASATPAQQDALEILIEKGQPNDRFLWPIDLVTMRGVREFGYIMPPRIKIGRRSIALNHDTKLFPHHLDDDKMYDFSKPLAVVGKHPSKPGIWGLKNQCDTRWTVSSGDGVTMDVEPGKSLTLTAGTKIHFGKCDGEIIL